MKAFAAILASGLIPLAFGNPIEARADNTSSSAASSSAATATSTAPGTSTSSNSTTTASKPKVTIYPSNTPNGQPVEIEGLSFGSLKQDVYLGIPFAAPPVEDLRFQPPQTPTWNTTSFSATKHSPACLQANVSGYGEYGLSEDCLYLNVYTPEGIDPSTQSLPVMVWVYGGSFVTGSANTYNATAIMAEAMQTDRPVIFVTVNYRLGIFGFPGGQEAAQANAANLGLKDVMASLDWVQENIWAFGGDSGSVTVFGESAGAILISQLFLQPDIKSFHRAIMESGAQSVAPIAPTEEFWQGPFDQVLKFTNCSSGASSSSNTSSAANATSLAATGNPIDCLRNVSAPDLLKAQLQTEQEAQYSAAFIFAPSIDGDLIPDSPHTLLSEGKFAKIPFISGNNLDEGTRFVPKAALPLINESTVSVLIDLFEPITNGSEQIYSQIAQVYPFDPAEGSPFGTGNETFGLPPIYKQLAAVLGDGTFQSSRRWFLQNAQQYGLDQTWTYLFTAPTPGQNASLGVAHADEVPFVFGLPILKQMGLNNTSLVSGNYSKQDAALSEQMINYWLNFAYYTDPNGQGGNATNWPTYGDQKNMIQFNVSDSGPNITLITDTYRQDQIQFFLDNPKAFNYRRDLEE